MHTSRKRENKMRTLARLHHKRLQNGTQSGDLQFKASQRGFTLIEVMIVVVVIGILASIAMPAYTDYVKRGKAVEATSELASARVRMEQYFQDNRTYVGGPCPAAGKYFTYACVVTATTYTITATNSAADMNGFGFTINEANGKTSTFDGTTPVPNTCWLTKKGGTC